MFTGLVAETGRIVSVAPRGTGRELWVRSAFRALEMGESIACDGVCLTVDALQPSTPGLFRVLAGDETLRVTTIGERAAGDALHLERALRVDDRMGGHHVQGHVDGVGVVRAVVPGAEWTRIDLAVPAELSRYVVKKGSICLDGVSLTINEVADEADAAVFSVGIIPHTVEVTKLGALRPGGRVNLEVDILARYVERLLGLGPARAGDAPSPARSGITLEGLRAAGFVKE